MEEIDFYAWLQRNWTMTGGLINQATAARLLKRSTSRITNMIKEGKLKEYRYNNLSFLSYPEVMRMAETIAIRNARRLTQKELEKLGLGKDINSGLMAQLDEALNYDPNEPEI